LGREQLVDQAVAGAQHVGPRALQL
jgi:hypothetical protein